MRFQGKSVIVTGAGFGIGRGIAVRFGKEGARVAIFDPDEKNSEESQRLVEEAGGEASVFHVDVSQRGEVDKAVASVAAEFGSVDVLVNNAGIRYIKTVLDLEDSEWERVISVNLNGAFYMVKAVAPIMLGQGGGKIVNIASMSGMLGQTGRAPYGATKAALMQLTRSLAVELGPSINVNAVAPGYIAGTGMMREVDSDPKSSGWMVANTPVHRAGKPEDVAAAVAFLASEEASFISGTTLTVDGGFSSSKYMTGGKF